MQLKSNTSNLLSQLVALLLLLTTIGSLMTAIQWSIRHRLISQSYSFSISDLAYILRR